MEKQNETHCHYLACTAVSELSHGLGLAAEYSGHHTLCDVIDRRISAGVVCMYRNAPAVPRNVITVGKSYAAHIPRDGPIR